MAKSSYPPWLLCGLALTIVLGGCGAIRNGALPMTRTERSQTAVEQGNRTALPPAKRPQGGNAACADVSRHNNAAAQPSSPRVLPPKYQTLCSTCHGTSGQGQGSSPQLTGVPLERMLTVVRQGTPGAMPSFSSEILSDSELRELVTALAVTPDAPTQGCLSQADQILVQHGDGLRSLEPKRELSTQCLTGTQSFEPGPTPESYVRLCASCHGGDGKGKGDIPGLLSVNKERFLQIVRSGVEGKMPAFEKELIGEADLHQLMATWQNAPLTAEQTESCASTTENLTPAQIREQGIAAARKPDAQGFACVSCHSPDLFDIAFLGYDEASIARRGLLHVDGENVKSVFRYVNQLRKEHNIPDRDPFMFRPFQPGGKPLDCKPGNGPGEYPGTHCDHVFGLELIKRVPTLALSRLGTLEQALQFKNEFLNLNPRTMPIAIPLNRWTEDSFRGPEHGRFNEWIPDISYRPNTDTDRAALHNLHDAYIANPSWTTLTPILKSIDTHASVPDATSRIQMILKDKYKSVLIASHLFRLQNKGESFASMPAFLDAMKGGYKEHFNPWWAVGDQARVVDNGWNDAEHLAMFAPSQLEKIVQPHTPRSEITSTRLTWFWLGFLYDNGVMHSGLSNSTNSTEYFTMQMYNMRYFTHVTYMRFQKLFAQAFRPGTSLRSDGKQFFAGERAQRWGYMLAYGNTWRDLAVRPQNWKLPPGGEKQDLFLRTQANFFRANALLLAHEARKSGVEYREPLVAGVTTQAQWLMKSIHNLDYARSMKGLTGEAAADQALLDDMFVALETACENRPLAYKEAPYPNPCPK